MSTIPELLQMIERVETFQTKATQIYPRMHFEQSVARVQEAKFCRGLYSNEWTALLVAYESHERDRTWNPKRPLFAAAKEISLYGFTDCTDEMLQRSEDGNTLTLYLRPRGMQRDTSNCNSHKYTVPNSFAEKLTFSIAGIPIMSKENRLVKTIGGDCINMQDLASALPDLAARLWPTPIDELPHWAKNGTHLSLPHPGDIYPLGNGYGTFSRSAWRFLTEEWCLRGVEMKASEHDPDKKVQR